MSPDRSVAASAPAYVRFKADGWPYCPGCGEDELWSPEVPATIESIFSCLACRWRPGYDQLSRERQS